MNIKQVEEYAKDIRIQIIRQLEAVGCGHIGGSMSAVDVLAVLYSGVMNVDPQNPQSENRDRLVFSKGHSGPALYAALALKGFFPVEWLTSLNKPHTLLPSHCDMNKTPGIDMTTGSLGQGLSIASGIACAQRLKGIDAWTYCILGDGECQEGQIWEAAMQITQQKLNNLIVFVDRNGMQVDGFLKDICEIGDVGEKFRVFGFNVLDANGHDHMEIYEKIQEIKKLDGPKLIVLNTIKGKGCSFAERSPNCHHLDVTHELAEEAINAIKESQ